MTSTLATGTTTGTSTGDAWLAWAARHGVPASATADLPPELEPCHDVMNNEPRDMPSLIAKLGQLLAWVHELPTKDAPGRVLTTDTALSRLDHEIIAAPDGVDVVLLGKLQRELGRRNPGQSQPVACHGDFTLRTVHVDPVDHHQVAMTRWDGAVLSDREYDVSLTELSLWATAYLTPEEEVRTMLKMARGFVRNGFIAGYRSVGPDLEPARLGWWGGHHVCRLLATIHLDLPPFSDWPTTVAAPVIEAFRGDLVQRFHDLMAMTDSTTDTEAGDPR